MRRPSIWLIIGLFSLTLGCQPPTETPKKAGGGSDQPTTKTGDSDKTPKVAYVTNGIASFWVIAEKGAQDAAKEHKAQATVLMPPNGVEDQKRMVEDLLVKGVDGVAISPIDPNNQGDLLKSIADKTRYITHDSDAPKSNRLCYIGMDNYIAGRKCGELVKESLPEGGTIMIFVGRLGQENARLRRQGVIDELMDRSIDSSRYDEPGKEVKGKKYTVLDTRTDDFDFGKAKALAEDAITKYPDLGCMVGLFAYNPPLMLEAVVNAKKVGKIKVVAFDEEDGTLRGIQNGSIHGTVVQNPYQYGYKSVELLAKMTRGDNSMIPESKFIDIPARQIRKDNVDAFWAELKKLTGADPAKKDSTKSDDKKADAKKVEEKKTDDAPTLILPKDDPKKE